MTRLIIMLTAMTMVWGCKGGGVEGDSAQSAMGFYAKGYNTLIRDMSSSILNEYFGDIPEAGPKNFAKIHLSPGYWTVERKIKEAKEAFDKARKSAPKELEHLAPIADKVIKHSEGAYAAFVQMYNYIDAKDYKDDKGTKAKKLHEQMLAHASGFNQSVGEFEQALDVIEFSQLESEVKKREGSKNAGYWFRRFNLDAKRLVVAAGSSDEDAYSKAFGQVEQAHTGLDQFVKGQGEKVHASFKSYKNSVDSFYSAAKRLNRVIKDAKPKPRELKNGMRDLNNRFNTVVSIGNSLYELEGHGLL